MRSALHVVTLVALVAIPLGAATMTAACDSPPPLDTAPNVDLTKFSGAWFEIAHLPRPTEDNCSGTKATYSARADGQFTFVHTCKRADGNLLTNSAVARIGDSGDPAKLQVDFGGFFGDYWILDLASDYRFALVGHPSRAYLWILSRTPTMSDADKQYLLTRSTALKFDTSNLVYTKQD